MKEVQPIRSLEQIQDMKNRLALNGKRDELLFAMGINTGLRISDLLPLKVVDVKRKREYILKERKTKKTKRIMLHAVYNDIEEYAKFKTDNEYLFASRRGDNKPITRVQAYRILNTAARDVGLKEVGTHTLRKTFGYHFYRKNQNIAMLQQLFNHSSPAITLRYIGITQDEIALEWGNFIL
jgi:integrase